MRDVGNDRVKKVAKAAKDNAFALADFAGQGAKNAAIELYETAALITQYLEFICRKNPAQFTAIAQEKFSWPVMYAPHHDSVRSAGPPLIKMQSTPSEALIAYNEDLENTTKTGLAKILAAAFRRLF